VLLELGKVHNPTTILANFTCQLDTHLKRMSVQAGTFVAIGDVGQAVGSLEMKLFINFHMGRDFTTKNSAD
jgi:hypothetical protein